MGVCENPITIGRSDTLDIIPDVFVRADLSQYFSREVVCVKASRPGYYRIFAQLEFSINQSNESFFLQICDEDSANCRNACDPNAGPYRIVDDEDVDEGETTSFRTKYSGIFYLDAGHNLITMTHYATIAAQFPGFVHGNFEGTESVHLHQLIFEQIDVTYDLELSQSVSVDSAATGDEYSYNLSIENVGTSTIHRITLWDVFPELTTPVQFSQQVEMVSGDTLFWRFDSLQAGESREIDFTVRVTGVPPQTPHLLENLARITGQCDRNDSNDFTSTTVTIPAPFYDLKLSKTASVDSVAGGGVFDYVLVVENSGPYPAFNVKLREILPEFISFTGVSLPTTATSGDTVFWQFESIAAGQSREIKINARLDKLQFPESFPIANTAYIYAESDVQANNNTASAIVDVIPIRYDLALTKSANIDTIRDGERRQFAYTLNLFNRGRDTAFDVKLWDSIPEHTTFANFSLAPNSMNADSTFWRFDSLAAGEQVTIRYGATISEFEITDPLHIINEAYVAGISDTNPSNNTATSVVIIMPPDDCIYLDRNVLQPSAGDPLKIFFQLSTNRDVKLDIYDLTGYHLLTLADQIFNAGVNTVLWNGNLGNGRKAGSGVYLITLKSKGLKCWTKVILAQ